MMKNMLIKVSIALIILLHNGCSNAIESPEAKLTLKVVGEDGSPLEKVNVGATFEVSKGTTTGIKYNTEKGTTDKDGVYIISGKTMFNVPYSAVKEGYYKSSGEYLLNSNINGRWQPWNPEIIVVLRKIVNPVPMYARHSRMSPIAVPELRKAIGFDLIAFDWVSPYGNGNHTDFIFRMTSTYKSEDDYDTKLELSFPNKFDGIQIIKEDRAIGSELKLSRIAPETGYQNKLIRSRSRAPGKSGENDQKEDNNYIFRIRSEENNGKFVRAMYGKIQGDIFVHPPSSIYFKYYLNPNYSRNLEFNPNMNLFKGLSSLEDVGLD
jgi:hypothetical protein